MVNYIGNLLSFPKSVCPFSGNFNKGPLFEDFLLKEGYVGIPKELESVLIPIFTFCKLPAYQKWTEIIKARDLGKENGIILCGLPGTGKTFFARILAEFLTIHSVHVTRLSAGNLLATKVGQTEKRIRNLFENHDHFKPNVILLDELDSIASSRNLAEHSWERSQVNQFLSYMDGLQKFPNTLVIGITNRLESIDDAFLRTGRFGTIIELPLPAKEQRLALFELYTRKLQEQNLIARDVDFARLSRAAEGLTPADIRGVVDKVNQVSFIRIVEQAYKNLKPKSSTSLIGMGDFLNEIHHQLHQKSNGRVLSKL